MTHLDDFIAALAPLAAPLRAAAALGRVRGSSLDQLLELSHALDVAARADRVDHGDLQRIIGEALDTAHEWWTPESLGLALLAVEQELAAARAGSIGRTWHPVGGDPLENVGQLGFEWGFHHWGACGWRGGFADEASARIAHDAHLALV